MKASILDLRRRMKDVLAALDRNEPVTITYRGRARGTLVPEGGAAGECKVREHPAFGMWADREDLADVPAAVRRLRKGRGHAL